MSTQLRFTIDDLELLPFDDGKRYEIIDGELYVSSSPHLRHQRACHLIGHTLESWNEQTEAGIVLPSPGVIFAQDEAVIPDLVWVSRERYARIVGDDGKLHAAPELVVEILSPGPTNEERDLEFKLKLYSRRGVREYWIVDWRDTTVRVYRQENAVLHLNATLFADDILTSPLLPGFSQRVGDLCAAPV